MKIRVKKYYLSLGTSLHCLEKFKEAIECFERAISIDPSVASPFHNKGLKVLYIGFSLCSLEQCEEAI
jgi:tetratricopeptide (TPR) repeat protein